MAHRNVQMIRTG